MRLSAHIESLQRDCAFSEAQRSDSVDLYGEIAPTLQWRRVRKIDIEKNETMDNLDMLIQEDMKAHQSRSRTGCSAHTVPKIRNIYFQKRNCAASLHGSASDLYIPSIGADRSWK
jgi:hypothetical protein